MTNRSTRNKQQQKSKPTFHFSYRQKAVFALVSNWAMNQFEDGLKTQHFVNLVYNKWRGKPDHRHKKRQALMPVFSLFKLGIKAGG